MKKFIFLVAVGVAVAAVVAILGINSGDGSSKTTINPPPTKPKPNYGNHTGVVFTIQNDARDGVWALTSPEMDKFGDRGERPLNAARWLANGRQVEVKCAVAGSQYNTTVNGEPTKWRFFALAEAGFYVPMAGFKETANDGPQGLVSCQKGGG
jgi:hypothetical protein